MIFLNLLLCDRFIDLLIFIIFMYSARLVGSAQDFILEYLGQFLRPIVITITDFYTNCFALFSLSLSLFAQMKYLLRKNMNERQNIPSLFRKNVLKHPHKRCFLYEDQVWTFHDVYQFANRVSNYFQKEVHMLDRI